MLVVREVSRSRGRHRCSIVAATVRRVGGSLTCDIRSVLVFPGALNDVKTESLFLTAAAEAFSFFFFSSLTRCSTIKKTKTKQTKH